MITENRVIETQTRDLFIFRTNIDKESEFLNLKQDMKGILGVHACTIDMEDCDKVLRVECENVTIRKVVEEVRRHGFFCEELED